MYIKHAALATDFVLDIYSIICVFCLQKNAIKVSKRLSNRPRKPVQLAADIVERALLTEGDRYLETHQHKLTWWQLSLLDVKVFLVMVIVAALALLAFLMMALGKALTRLSHQLWQNSSVLGGKDKVQ